MGKSLKPNQHGLAHQLCPQGLEKQLFVSSNMVKHIEETF